MPRLVGQFFTAWSSTKKVEHLIVVQGGFWRTDSRLEWYFVSFDDDVESMPLRHEDDPGKWANGDWIDTTLDAIFTGLYSEYKDSP